MQKRFSTHEANVANTATVEDFQGSPELPGIDPSQVLVSYFPAGEVAEVTRGITGVCDGDIAESGAAMTDEVQHVPHFRSDGGQWHMSKIAVPPTRWSESSLSNRSRYIHGLPDLRECHHSVAGKRFNCSRLCG